MAEMTISLRVDPQTGKKNIIVSLTSDPDSLPHEHEQEHRALVEKLIEGGPVKEGEIGMVIVELETEQTQGAPQQSEQPQDQRESLGEGS